MARTAFLLGALSLRKHLRLPDAKGSSEAGKQHMAFSARGRHSCTEFFVLVSKDRGLLCAAKPRARTHFSNPHPGACQGQVCHWPFQVCLQNKLAQTWTSCLKTQANLLIPMGSHGSVAQKLGCPLLSQGAGMNTPLLCFPLPRGCLGKHPHGCVVFLPLRA